MLKEINMEHLDNDELLTLIEVFEKELTTNKHDSDLQMKLKDCCFYYLKSKHGNEAIYVNIYFNDGEKSNYEIQIKMAPIELVPYSVYFFLNIIESWKGGCIHRNAGHVKQFKIRQQTKHLAFQEYHHDYPHKKFTCGFAGRPGGPAFYINTRDNTRNHGPGSQGSQTEADSCFGEIDETNINSIEILKRINNMKVNNRSGFVSVDEELVVSHVQIGGFEPPTSR